MTAGYEAFVCEAATSCKTSPGNAIHAGGLVIDNWETLVPIRQEGHGDGLYLIEVQDARYKAATLMKSFRHGEPLRQNSYHTADKRALVYCGRPHETETEP